MGTEGSYGKGKERTSEGAVGGPSKENSPTENGTPEDLGVEVELLRKERKTLEAQVEKVSKKTETLTTVREEIKALVKEARTLKKDLNSRGEALERKTEEFKEVLEKMEQIREGLKEDKETLELVMDNALEEFLETGKRELRKMTEALARPAKAISETIEDDLKEAVGRVEDLNERIEDRYQKLGGQAAQVVKVSESIEGKAESVKTEIQEVKQLRENFGEHVEVARKTAEILKSAALENDLKELKEFSTKTLEDTYELGAKVQEQMVNQVDNLLREILNELDERRRRVSKKLETGDRVLKQRINEMQSIRTAVADMEDRLDREVESLVKEARSITLRQAVIIIGAVFLGVVLSRIVFDVLPIVFHALGA